MADFGTTKSYVHSTLLDPPPIIVSDCPLLQRSGRSFQSAWKPPPRVTPPPRIHDPRGQSRRRRDIRLKHLYGITSDDFDRMLESQEGRCRICGSTPHKPLAVDHCHSSGRVRGLLCGQCNTGLGNFRDDPEALRAAAAYLEAFAE